MEIDLTFLEAIKAIKQKHGHPEKQVFESMECPKCQGELVYAVSSINGHTRGKCETENCLVWME